MMIARVIGTVVSTRKEPTIEGLRLLVCQPVNADGEKAGAPVVAADAVGSRRGRNDPLRHRQLRPANGRHAESAGRRGGDGDRRQLGSRRRVQVPQERRLRITNVAQLSEQQVDAIAQQVLQRLAGGTVSHAPSGGGGGSGEKRLGAFNDMDSAVKAAQDAFKALDKLPLVKRDEIIASIRKASLAKANRSRFRAHRETGFGRYEDKIIKNRLVANKTPGTEVLQAEVKTGDGGLSLFERAPFGVIGSITPSTNPTATIINNTISMVAAGNAVVFNVHPSAKECSIRCVDVINRAIVEAGGPAESDRHDGRADARIGPGTDGA